MRRIAFALGVLALWAPSHAVIWGFAAPVMNGLQEVPPNNSQAYGTISFTLNDQTFALEGSMNIWGMNGRVLASHIHTAPAGVNGPVIFDLLANQVAGSPIVSGNMTTFVFRGTLANGATHLPALLAGNTYANAHSALFPGGEVRGQIECIGAVPEPATLAVLGLGLVPILRRNRRA